MVRVWAVLDRHADPLRHRSDDPAAPWPVFRVAGHRRDTAWLRHGEQLVGPRSSQRAGAEQQRSGIRALFLSLGAAAGHTARERGLQMARGRTERIQLL